MTVPGSSGINDVKVRGARRTLNSVDGNTVFDLLEELVEGDSQLLGAKAVHATLNLEAMFAQKLFADYNPDIHHY